MRAEDFLEPAREAAAGPSEAYWRTAAGRAYYALFGAALAALDRWGFAPRAHDNPHHFARLRLIFSSDPGVRAIGKTLEDLSRLRNTADYHLGPDERFETRRPASNAVARAIGAVHALQAIESNPARRQAAIASIRP